MVVATLVLADPAEVVPLEVVPGTLGADRDIPVVVDRDRDTGTDRGKVGPAEAAGSRSLAVVPIRGDRPCRGAKSQDQPLQADSPGASADLRVVAGSSVRSEVLS